MSAANWKIGDRAKIKDCPELYRSWSFTTVPYKANIGEECEIVKIDGVDNGRIYVKFSDGHPRSINVIHIEPADIFGLPTTKKCECDITTLMRYGCRCQHSEFSQKTS